MMKKSTQTLLLVLSSFLLLISITASASAQEDVIRGYIKWNKELGVVPEGPSNSKAARYPCSVFYVAALDARNNQPVTYTNQAASHFQKTEEGDYYFCGWALRVPQNRSLYIVAGMGGVQLLPKKDRSPMYISDAWIGGARSKPPAGYERSLTGFKNVTLRGGGAGDSRTPTIVNFQMTYVRMTQFKDR